MSVHFFRSEDIDYYNLIMPRENAWEILNELGELDALHFVESETGANFSKPFANFIKRCEEVNSKLSFIEEQMKKFNKPIIKCDNHKEYLQYLKNYLGMKKTGEHNYLEEVETEIDQKTKQIQDQLRSYEDICNKKNYCLEYRAVLIKARAILGNSAYFKEKLDYQQPQKQFNSSPFEEEKDVEVQGGLEVKPIIIGGVKVNYLVGVILAEDYERFNKIIFRVSYGNVIANFEDINSEDLREDEDQQDLIDIKQLIDPKNQKPIRKKVFLLIFTGGELNSLKKKLIRICESFGVKRHDIPDNISSFEERLKEAQNQLKETRNLVALTETQLHSHLNVFSEFRNEYSLCSLIEEYRLFILKEKCIYQYMNNLRIENNIFIGNVWIPQDHIEKVQKSLKDVGQKNVHVAAGQLQKSIPPESLTPPTYLKTNDFTWAFQEIVNTYGVPRYKEINPGLFTIITFPFLFGVMFGDIGHGFLLLCFGLYLIISDERNKREKSSMALLSPARYLITLMGLFATYCGFIYNEIFAFSINFFGSCYNPSQPGSLELMKEKNCTYYFGLDPVWSVSDQEIGFNNSLKMKMSVIFGVVQMSLGVIMKGINSIYFRKMEDFFFEFVPQIIFMLLTFGYMDAMIIIKWCTNWDHEVGNSPPGLINTFMQMVLSLGAPPDKELLWHDESSQKTLQILFLIIAVVCIPWMLIPKPCYLLHKKKKKHVNPEEKHNTSLGYMEPNNKENLKKPLLKQPSGEDLNNANDLIQDIQANKEEDVELKKVLQEHRDKVNLEIAPAHDAHDDTGEIVVHQVIETIEFVLGSISNTASYLRLWALSLAHGQLAKVFFDYGIIKPVENSAWMLFATFFIFANITFGVLMCMDVMECFLHALRLHWVEFQNKFYKADGYKYNPMSFSKSLEIGSN